MEDLPPGQLQASGWKISSEVELSKQLYLQFNAFPTSQEEQPLLPSPIFPRVTSWGWTPGLRDQ